MKIKQMAGKRFGCLDVLKFSHMHNRIAYWLCKCSCGKIVLGAGYRLRNGHKKSCGCLRGKYSINRMDIIKTHGMSNERFYVVWAGIKTRCLCVSNKSYKNYGGRGITVCDRWMKFKNFYEDMFPDYCEHAYQHGEKNTTIERKDNDGNYDLSNCRWATWEVQQNNRRNNVKITFNNKIKTMSDWAKEYNINCDTLRYRIRRSKWDFERALTEPTREYIK